MSEISLTLPPLAERGEDPVLLATYFLNRSSTPGVGLSTEAQNAFRAHDWPGNIRELENRIKRASILCEGGTISAADLELADQVDEALPLNLKAVRATAERQAIQQALSQANHNISQAARSLGVSRPTLYNLF